MRTIYYNKDQSNFVKRRRISSAIGNPEEITSVVCKHYYSWRRRIVRIVLVFSDSVPVFIFRDMKFANFHPESARRLELRDEFI